MDRLVHNGALIGAGLTLGSALVVAAIMVIGRNPVTEAIRVVMFPGVLAVGAQWIYLRGRSRLAKVVLMSKWKTSAGCGGSVMLKFWELPPSPNNTKVRMALRFKGIDFETVPVNPRDRSDVVAASGQELTPIIEDRGIVLNDSEAILAYLDANYRDTPRVIPADRAGRKQADAWKIKLDEGVMAYWVPIFLVAIGRRDSFKPSTRQGFEDFLKGLEDELDEVDGFCGPESPICDLRVAEWATYALPGIGLIERAPLFGRFRELFGIAAGSLPALEKFLEPWNERLA